MRAIIICTIALGLGGCAHGVVGSVAGGDCKIGKVPPYAVKGKERYDQKWIDNETERLVAGCKQPRPKARPASLDQPKMSKAVPVAKVRPAGLHRAIPAALRPEPAPEVIHEFLPAVEPAVLTPDPVPSTPAPKRPPATTKTPWWHWKFWAH